MGDTLARRLFLILLIGAALSAAAALWLSDAAYRRRHAEEGFADAAARIAAAMQVLPSGGVYPGVRRAPIDAPLGPADPAFAGRLNESMGRDRARTFRTGPSACAPTPPRPSAVPSHPAPPPPKVRPKPGPDDALPAPLVDQAGSNCRLVLIDTADGALRLAVSLPPDPASLTAGRFGLVFIGVLGLAAGLLAWITARLAVRPLRRLSLAAVGLGDDLDRPPLPLDGPQEVREAAAAFNTMQTRLKAAMADRTRVLAAITHDLQTPLTRMRLRLDKVADADLRDRLLADFAATQVLIREGLELARDADSDEPWGLVDIPSLIDALVEDMFDAGLPVRVVANEAGVVRARPQALRRALGNLIDNAIKHAGSADVASTMSPDGGTVITVCDHGPGVPEDQLAAVFEPFHRVDASRSRDRGGAGLGLTIAQRMAKRTGAVLTLENSVDGGLRASLEFNAGTHDRERPPYSSG